MRTLLTLAALSCSTLPALAHEAPTGWRYGLECCSNRDCREVPSSSVQEVVDGYRIVPSLEIVPYGDKRIKDSPDGLYHWCSQGGTNTGKTICLYVPPRAM